MSPKENNAKRNTPDTMPIKEIEGLPQVHPYLHIVKIVNEIIANKLQDFKEASWDFLDNIFNEESFQKAFPSTMHFTDFRKIDTFTIYLSRQLDEIISNSMMNLPENIAKNFRETTEDGRNLFRRADELIDILGDPKSVPIFYQFAEEIFKIATRIEPRNPESIFFIDGEHKESFEKLNKLLNDAAELKNKS
jgi:hypothetical protein